MTTTPPPSGPPGGIDPLVSSLDALVRSGHLSPESARAALIAAGGGSDTPGAGPGAGTHAASATGSATDARKLRMILPFDAALVAIGVGFLFVVAVLTALYARTNGQLVPDPATLLGGGAGGGSNDLDLSVYLLGVVATVALVAVAVAGRLLGGTRAISSTLVGWSAAFATIAVAIMVGVGFDGDSSAFNYLISGIVVVLGALGYVASRQAAPLFVTIFGLLTLYAQVANDLLDAIGLEGDSHPWLLGASTVFVFVVIVTVVGLVLTPRGFGGAVAGWISVITHAVVMIGIAVSALIEGVIGGFSGEAPEAPADYDLDIYGVLVLSVVLILVWAVCYLLTENVTYRLLIVLMLVGTLPAATVALSVESPSVWQIVAGVLGLLALGFALVRSLRSERSSGSATHLAPPSAPSAPSA